MLVDSHAHLETLDNLEELLRHAKSAGVSKIITIGTNLKSSKQAIDLAEKYTSGDLQIYATVGIHPFDGGEEIEEKGLERCLTELSEVAQTSKKVVGIGEAGLDYYPTSLSQGELRGTSKKPFYESQGKPATTDDDKTYQRKLFGEQIKLAKRMKLPLVVHCRNAWDEIFKQLDKIGLAQCVFHSFTGDASDMEAAAALGYYVSFSGIVTFKNAPNLADCARKVPQDKFLIETDSPYLSPEPFRGQKNEPANVKTVAKFIAQIRGSSTSTVEEETGKNAAALFSLK